MSLVSRLLWVYMAIDACTGTLNTCQWSEGLTRWQKHQDPTVCPARQNESGTPEVDFSSYVGVGQGEKYVDFEAHGFSAEGIPEALPAIMLPLLHENSVVHLLDAYRHLVLVSSGADAAVYLGEDRATGRQVVIKQFYDRDLEGIAEEAAMLNYLQTTGLFPRLLGLMPGGSQAANMTLVMEYVADHYCLWDMVDESHALTPAQWLDVAAQICRALLTIHSKFVLHNDFHSTNILVQWRGNKPRIFVIDAGHATFRSAMAYENKDGSINSTRFYAPEVKARQYTSLAADVFSLGYALLKINKVLLSADLQAIGEHCMQHDPADRPSVKEVLAEVEELHQLVLEEEEMLHDLPHNPGFNARPPVNVEQLPLPFLLRSSTKPYLREGKKIWLTDDEDGNSIYVAVFRTTGQYVVVKLFSDVPLKDIRTEAAINFYLGVTGYVPKFYGIRTAGSRMDDMSIVQEYFGQGATMEDLLEKLTERDDELRFQLALEVSRAVTMFHGMGVLVNNIKCRNILVRLVGYRPQIRFIDLDQASVGKGVWVSRHPSVLEESYSLAPEIRNATSPTTWASDVYSMCYAILNIVHTSSDDDVKNVTQSCLQQEPHRRPTAREIADYFAKVVNKYEHL